MSGHIIYNIYISAAFIFLDDLEICGFMNLIYLYCLFMVLDLPEVFAHRFCYVACIDCWICCFCQNIA